MPSVVRAFYAKAIALFFLASNVCVIQTHFCLLRLSPQAPKDRFAAARPANASISKNTCRRDRKGRIRARSPLKVLSGYCAEPKRNGAGRSGIGTDLSQEMKNFGRQKPKSLSHESTFSDDFFSSLSSCLIRRKSGTQYQQAQQLCTHGAQSRENVRDTSLSALLQ